jgi:hypothetical protein
MLKNFIITILTIIVVIFWLKDEPNEEYDPEGVIIEYNCKTLNEYENVPPEVVEECRNRINHFIKPTV